MPLRINSAGEACRLWGDFRAEGALRGVFRPKGGGSASTDDLAAIAAYVETTKGFDLAMPALRWMYVLLRPDFYGFSLRGALPCASEWVPGEYVTLEHPITRHPMRVLRYHEVQVDWHERYIADWRPFGGDSAGAATRLSYRFEDEISRRLDEEPYYRPASFEGQSAAEIGDSINSELQSALMRASPRRGGFGEESRRPSKGNWWKK